MESNTNNGNKMNTERNHAQDAADSAIEFSEAYDGGASMAEDYYTDSDHQLSVADHARAWNLIQAAFSDGFVIEEN